MIIVRVSFVQSPFRPKCPNSTSSANSWDVIRGGYGPDVAAIDAALVQTISTLAVDSGHLAIAGFSDGGSYALSLGVTNGCLFTHVMAFSPGFLVPSRTEDSPSIFVTHGTDDGVLPIDRCSRQLVPRLRQVGYDVVYEEVPTGHVVPPRQVEHAFAWFLADRSAVSAG